MAIQISGLVKNYGRARVLDGIDLDIPTGSVMGLLGPNGAGKTTTVRVVTTLLRPNAGKVQVAGVDVLGDPATARTRIGVSGQYAAVDANLTGFENLHMVARLYGMSSRRATARAEELLVALGLEQAAGRRAGTYSGGMTRRLDLAGALVARPPVVVLDEPTTGLDPRGRLDVWDVIKELVSDGTTVLLTTQYLEEADQLADRITVLDAGRVIARGSADELKNSVGGDRLTVTLLPGQHPGQAMSVLAQVGVGEPIYEPDTAEVAVGVAEGSRTMVQALRRLDDAGVCVVDAVVRRPSLDDVFLALTGDVPQSLGPDAVDNRDDDTTVLQRIDAAGPPPAVCTHNTSATRGVHADNTGATRGVHADNTGATVLGVHADNEVTAVLPRISAPTPSMGIRNAVPPPLVGTRNDMNQEVVP